MNFFGLLLWMVGGTIGVTFEELDNELELEYEGSFDGGFDIEDYINNNELFDEFRANISSRRYSNPRLRNMRNEIQPIDFSDFSSQNAFDGPNGFDDQMMASTRKFKHVAGLVMFLQSVPILGKYIFYGCYCFSDAQYELDAGHGKPVDAVDGACKAFHQCYSCVNKDFVEGKGQAKCDGTGRSYRFKGIIDPVTGGKEIQCLNEEGSCRRSICECDKTLAKDLSRLENEWDFTHHQKWGFFDKSRQCQGASGKSMSIGDRELSCCGQYPNRYVYTSKNKDGEEHGCCSGKTFDINGGMECCEGELVPMFTCGGQTTTMEFPYAV